MNKKIANATKWSALTQIIAKLITPITNIVLAHILAPETFGIMATILMIISFAEMISDAGFQKFIIQHEFKNREEYNDNVNVAFWANSSIAILLWIIIILNKSKLAIMVGSPGLGIPLSIMGLSLPFTAFSSIQRAILSRDFDFKSLLKIRIVEITIPIFVTIPLAFLGLGIWALIIGLLTSQILVAILLFIISPIEIKVFFNLNVLKGMFAFSSWSLLESLTIWLTNWVDTFIVGSYLSSYYLGIYKMPVAVVNTIMSLITATVLPVLYSALSREQNDMVKFEITLFTFQKYVGMLILPMGIGIYIYKDFLVKIIFGNNWDGAGLVIGAWGLSSAITIVLSFLMSEVFRAKGAPKLSVLVQFLHLICLVPVIYYFVQIGFKEFIYARSLVRFQLVAVNMIVFYLFIKINPIRLLMNVFKYIVCSIVMGGFSYILIQYSNSIVWSIITIFISIILYFMLLLLFKEDRNIIKETLYEVKKTI